MYELDCISITSSLVFRIPIIEIFRFGLGFGQIKILKKIHDEGTSLVLKTFVK